MNEIEVLNAALAVGWVKFAYFKADGTRRLAIGTRNRALIEQVLGRRLKDNGSDGSFYTNCNGYFDLTRVDWRQFKTERFIGILFDKMTNEQAVAHALTLSLIESGRADGVMEIAHHLIGAMAMPIMTEIGNVYARTRIDEDEIRATEQILEIAESDINDKVVLKVSLGTPAAERTAKVKTCRAALKAELAALRKREDEILKLLLAD
jgi:hypothetical protein